MTILKNNHNTILEKLFIVIATIAISVFIGLLSYNQLTSTDALSGRWIVVALYLILIIFNCSLIKKVENIKCSEKHQRSATGVIIVLLCIFTMNLISSYNSMMSSFHYGNIDSYIAKLTTYFLPNFLTTASLFIVLVISLFKAKKNPLPVVLMLVNAACCIYELVITLSNPFAPNIVYDNSAWSVLRSAAHILLFAELAVLLLPNNIKKQN